MTGFSGFGLGQTWRSDHIKYHFDIWRIDPPAEAGFWESGRYTSIPEMIPIYAGIWLRDSGYFGMGIFCDRAGNDDYQAAFSAQGSACFGIGLASDVTGDDQYFSFDDKSRAPHPRASNNSIWLAPDRSDSTYGVDNFGVGIDHETGSIPEISKWYIEKPGDKPGLVFSLSGFFLSPKH